MEVPKNQLGRGILSFDSIGGMEPKEPTTCTVAGSPMEQWGHQSTHKTFNPKFILSTRNAGMLDGAETEGIANL